MADADDTEPKKAGASSRAPPNLVTFFVAFGFVWLVFDNMALGLIFALLFAGGSEVAQRTAAKKSD